MAFESLKRRLRKQSVNHDHDSPPPDNSNADDTHRLSYTSTDFSNSSSHHSNTMTPSSSNSTSDSSMRAIAVTTSYGGIDALSPVSIPKPPAPSGHDLLIRVLGSSLNPVDTKIRAGTYDDYQVSRPAKNPTAYYEHAPALPHVLGFDGAGTIEAMGPDVSGFEVGDEVFYSGDPRRQGSNAEFQLVDSRGVSTKPERLDFVEAASMPLTWITAWEALVERLEIPIPTNDKNPDENAGILIVNGAGGVGSLASQIARHVLKMPVVVSTASRDETTAFCKEMGATHVVNHREDIPSQIEKLGLEVPIRYIFVTSRTEQYLEIAAEVAAPFGKICSIVQTQGMDGMYGTQWMAKGLTFVWELLATKVVYGVEESAKAESHGRILKRLKELVDQGVIHCHMNHQLPATEAGIRKAHELQESGTVIGKIGIGKDGSKGAEGFEDSIY